jgi:hypothetical protein
MKKLLTLAVLLAVVVPAGAEVVFERNFNDGNALVGFGFDGSGGGTLEVTEGIGTGAGPDGTDSLHVTADASAATGWWVQNYNTNWVGYTLPTMEPGEFMQVSLDAKGSEAASMKFALQDTDGSAATQSLSLTTEWQTLTIRVDEMTDYSTMIADFNGGFLTFGTGINQGWGFDAGNEYWVDNVMLEVVPEPATMALLGLGGLAVLRRRRKA